MRNRPRNCLKACPSQTLHILQCYDSGAHHEFRVETFDLPFVEATRAHDGFGIQLQLLELAINQKRNTECTI